ncbi:MAG: PKD domain-containing protein, partial [Candidatus Methanomethylophilaceae archaeon]|nr:PKD domain-containing protein [Candidatus Methanomethylophilaceae archaeon]
EENVLATGTTSLAGMGIANGIPLFGTCYLYVSHGSASASTTIDLDPVTGEFEFKVISLTVVGSDNGAYGYLSAQVSGTTVTFIDSSFNAVSATVLGNSFYIADASLGDGTSYTMVIRVPGYDDVMANVTYNSGTDYVLGDNLTAAEVDTVPANGRALMVQLDDKAAKNTDVQTIVFGADYNSFDWIREVNNSFAVHFPNVVPALPIRMQIDANNSGDVNQTELDNFVAGIGEYMAVTDSFLLVNGVAYQSAGSFAVNAGDELLGSVYSTDPYTIVYSNQYDSKSAIEAGAASYTASLNIRYDSADLNRSFILDLPDNYELNSQVTSTQYVRVSSEDYNNFTVHPLTYTGSGEWVGMTFNTYGVPSSSGLIDASDYAHAYYVDSVLQHYIVGKGQTVTFNGSASTDSNGNPLARFVWDFGDGNDANVTNATLQHTYNVANATGHTVTLMVINHNGSMSEASTFTVLVDDVDPTSAITVVTANPTAGSSVSFSGLNSTDSVASAGDGLGIIAKWIWNFGDGSANVTKTSDNGNVSKTFTAMGSYNVTLTVVDVAGNSNSIVQQVQVLRSAMPSLSIQSVTYSPTVFEEGAVGTISVNVENNGDWTANQFTVSIYKVVGTETELLTSELITTPLAPGENVTVEISYTFGAQGDYRLKVTVEDDDPRTSDSNDFSSLTVNEAGWKSIAIFVGVIVVIGVIVALVYYRNRLPGRDSFKKGGPKDNMAPLKQERTLPKEEPMALEEPKKKAPAGSKSKKR